MPSRAARHVAIATGFRCATGRAPGRAPPQTRVPTFIRTATLKRLSSRVVPGQETLSRVHSTSRINRSSRPHSEHTRYDAFGGITAETNAAVDHLFGYTGREWDAEAGLFYYRFRWYDADVGRFISEDRLGFAGGDANLSRYVGNNPASSIDPFGLRAQPVIVPGFGHMPLNPDTDPDAFAAVVAGATAQGGGRPWDWLDYSANAAAGFGDAITFGATWHIRDYSGFNDGIDTDSWTYFGGHVAGTGVSIAAGVGVGAGAQGGALALNTAKAYIVAGDAYGVGVSSYHVYTQEFTAYDTLGFLPMAGYGLGRLQSRRAITEAANAIDDYLGPHSRAFLNDADALILQSKNGLREVRLDFNNTAPHSSAHIHVLEYKIKKNNKVEVVSDRIFPQP